MKWMTPRSYVAVQHGHLPFISPFDTSWLTSHLVCEIYQILLDIYLAYSWNIQVQVSDWTEYSRYMLSILQYKLDIYPLDLYIWHTSMPDILWNGPMEWIHALKPMKWYHRLSVHSALLPAAPEPASSLCSYLVSAALILLSLTRSLLILSASVMDTIRGRPLP